MNTVLPVNQARRHLGQLVEEAFYLNKPFTLTRSNRPMAVVVGNGLFTQMVKLVEKYDHGLADSLALMTNPDLQAILAEDEQYPETAVPFDETLLVTPEMKYSLEIRSGARRLFRKLPSDVQQKVLQEAQTLATNPNAGKPLSGKYRQLRSLKFNYKGVSYRIAYQVFSKTSTILIRLTGTRENFYQHLERLTKQG